MIQIKLSKWEEFNIPLINLDVDTLEIDQTTSNFDLIDLNNLLNNEQVQYTSVQQNIDNVLQLDIEIHKVKSLDLQIITFTTNPTLAGYRANPYYNTNNRPELLMFINRDENVAIYKCKSVWDLLSQYDGVYFGTSNTLMLDIKRPDRFTLINFSLQKLFNNLQNCINECAFSNQDLLIPYNVISSSRRLITERNCLLPPFDVVDRSYIEQKV